MMSEMLWAANCFSLRFKRIGVFSSPVARIFALFPRSYVAFEYKISNTRWSGANTTHRDFLCSHSS